MPRRLSTVAEAAAWLAGRLPAQAAAGAATLRTDSRQLRAGDAFIAWPGYASDGRQFVAAALAEGAAACLVEAEGLDAWALDADDPRIACLSGLKAATGEIAAIWFDRPSEQLQVIAVTGTNGKSSTAWWTAQALTALGRRCAVVGTLGIGEPPLAASPGSLRPTGLTTPDPVTLQAALRRLADTGFAAVAVEASSIGLAEHRLAGLPVTVAQFTNLSRDHLDYHGDMPTYWAAKRALFGWPALRAAVVNIDDAHGAALALEPALAGLDLWTTSLAERPSPDDPSRALPSARLQALHLTYTGGGLAFTVAEGDARAPVRSALIGDYNAHNLLAVLGALRALGVPLAQAVSVVPLLTPVPGRMDRVAALLADSSANSSAGSSSDPAADPAAPAAAAQPEVVVDYAHTPDALDKALAALRPLAAARGGRLWCVFGCGGNRDASKRPLMGAIAQRGADRLVLTSDNPRNERPVAILDQILAGMADPDAVQVIEDRRAAITHAVLHAAPQDVVLLAGKGHEETQEVAGVKRPFRDSVVATQALQMRGAA